MYCLTAHGRNGIAHEIPAMKNYGWAVRPDQHDPAGPARRAGALRATTAA
ncbi:hypothetical protein BURMUCGD2M_4470 [Burkholderia multivorans CGD2M]|nr:hypothetical protein BURMUCGD2M_4470 [Burkholderia multivorans CGD2M]